MKGLRAVGREKQEYNSFCFLSISSSSVSPVTRTGVGICSFEIKTKNMNSFPWPPPLPSCVFPPLGSKDDYAPRLFRRDLGPAAAPVGVEDEGSVS